VIVLITSAGLLSMLGCYSYIRPVGTMHIGDNNSRVKRIALGFQRGEFYTMIHRSIPSLAPPGLRHVMDIQFAGLYLSITDYSSLTLVTEAGVPQRLGPNRETTVCIPIWMVVILLLAYPLPILVRAHKKPTKRVGSL